MSTKVGALLVRESEIEAYLVKRVREAGGLTYKFTSPGRAGVPDRIVVLKGRVSFVEIKAPGKRPTVLQQRELARLREHGVTATWTSSREDIDAIMDMLAQ